MKASLLTCVVLLCAAPITDWQKAYNHAKNGKTVQLVVRDATLGNDFPAGVLPAIRVYIVDGDKRYYVASVVPFPKDATSTFLFDLRVILSKLPNPPSDDAKIVIRSGGGTYKSLEVNLK